MVATFFPGAHLSRSRLFCLCFGVFFADSFDAFNSVIQASGILCTRSLTPMYKILYKWTRHYLDSYLFYVGVLIRPKVVPTMGVSGQGTTDTILPPAMLSSAPRPDRGYIQPIFKTGGENVQN